MSESLIWLILGSSRLIVTALSRNGKFRSIIKILRIEWVQGLLFKYFERQVSHMELQWKCLRHHNRVSFEWCWEKTRCYKELSHNYSIWRERALILLHYIEPRDWSTESLKSHWEAIFCTGKSHTFEKWKGAGMHIVLQTFEYFVNALACRTYVDLSIGGKYFRRHQESGFQAPTFGGQPRVLVIRGLSIGSERWF